MRDVRRMRGSGKAVKGSKSPGVGYLYVITILFLALGAATVMTGGLGPTDPTTPGAIPTLDPYFDPSDYGKQNIILPTAMPGNPGPLVNDARKNLQLKTFNVNTCGYQTAIDFLIDTSGSMKLDGKIGKEQSALRAFTKDLAGKAGISMQTFGQRVDDKVGFDYYKNVKEKVKITIDGLKPFKETRTREGFEIAKKEIIAAKANPKFKGYHFALILLTDGVPEIPPDKPRTCYFQAFDPTYGSNRCFAKEEDPRIPENIPEQLKGMGVTIATIGIYSQGTTDKLFYPYLSSFLKDVTSKPLQDHYFESIEGDNLKKILDQVLTNVCVDQALFE
jgi:hypothetical protein